MKVFSFEKEEISNYIRFDLDTFRELPDSLKYVADQLEKHKHCLKIKSLTKFDLNKVKEREGKNYHWSCFKYKNITLVVRRYHSHLTIFTMFAGEKRDKYGAFTFHTDFDKFGDEADNMRYEHYEKPFIDLNVIAKDLFEMMLESNGNVWMVWNSVSLPRGPR